ncbi:MAG TPA: TIGR03936 family radical SAM-associated protein [Gaiellales bacterium]|nr:TIGR03936 family radical SAM-associated protein [Gaiellales bacterium]
MTYRFTFAVRGRARFLSHLETVDTLLSAIRRAGYQVALSRGMKPRPVIALALPRAVGVESEGELADIELTSDPDPAELRERLGPQLPAGFDLLVVEPAEGKQAASRVRAVRYLVETADGVDWHDAVARYLQSDEAVVTRTAPNKADKRVDVRRFCGRLQPVRAGLEAEIELTDAGTARPEEVATAVAATTGATPTITRIVRTEIVLRDAAVGAHT